MESIFELKLTDKNRVDRYPWDHLREVGDVLVIHGAGLDPFSAREMLYRYARRRGWKIETHIRDGRLHCFRVGIDRIRLPRRYP